MTATLATTACKECGREIEFEPLEFYGKAVGTPGYCDKCLDTLWKEEEAEELRQRYETRLDRSQLPENLRSISLPADGLGEIAGRWAREELAKPGLCLVGPVGVGKTYLAAAACWERLKRKGCLWVPVARLLTELHGGFNEGREKASKIIAGTGAIVLDDLDKINPTEHGKSVIFAAVDGRVEAGVPLLVTTNLGLAEVEAKLGDAVASRLMGHCEVLRLEGEDRRAA